MQAFEKNAARIKALRVMLTRGVVKLVYSIEYNRHKVNMLSYATTNVAFMDSEAWPDGAEDPSYDFISEKELPGHVLFFDYQRQMWVNVNENDITCVFKKVLTSTKEWANCSYDFRWEKTSKNGHKGYKLFPAAVHNNDVVHSKPKAGALKWPRADVASDKRDPTRNLLKEVADIEDEELMMLELYKLLKSFFLPLQEDRYQSFSKTTMADIINEYIETNLKNREDCI
jgi:hypothetical protein